MSFETLSASPSRMMVTVEVVTATTCYGPVAFDRNLGCPIAAPRVVLFRSSDSVAVSSLTKNRSPGLSPVLN